jgi:hypothetical protein
MKFTVPVACGSCGRDFSTLGYGELTFPPATCPSCGQTIHIIDPLTFSVIAQRLLYRGDAELKNGDFTMPIICGAMAIESALTSLFLKWRQLEHGFPGNSTTDADRETWEKEYRDGTRPGGFPNSANFVSSYLTGKSFDGFAADFLRRSSKAAIIGAGLPMYESQMKTDYINRELFYKRNRIMHWGEVKYEKSDAEKALAASGAAFALLTVMDKEKAAELDRKMRASSAPTAYINPQ